MTNKITGLILALLLIASAPFGANATGTAASPSKPAPAGNLLKRQAKVDGNQRVLTPDVYGWQVFTVFNKANTVVLVTDNQGVAPLTGILHQYCRGLATGPVGNAYVGDSNATDTFSLTPGGFELGPLIQSSLTQPSTGPFSVCSPILDAQFLHGLVAEESDSAPLYIYWSPNVPGEGTQQGIIGNVQQTPNY